MQPEVLDGVLDHDGAARATLVDIPTAAERLGLTVDGIRKRIQRRQLASVKRDGRVYVVLDEVLDTPSNSAPPPPAAPSPSSSTASSTVSSVSTESLAAQLARADAEIVFLRQELERKDAIIMRLVEQHALPAPAPPSAPPEPHRETVPDSPRPWWRRWWPR